MTPTEVISHWIGNTNHKDIPRESLRAAEVACFDCLGVILAGSVQTSGTTFTRYVKQLGGQAESTLVPAGFRTSSCNAALCNGTLGHALDYDDSGGGISHSAAVLFPALLAVAEKIGASGKELLEAYVVGFEVGGILASGYKAVRGFHKTAVFGRMAATAACVKLLRLDDRQIQTALGIAASMASGLLLNHGTMTKPLHAGLAARDGVMAAELAGLGWTANTNIIEHPLGFVVSFCGEETTIHEVVQRLGKPFTIHNSMIIKKYPCGLINHPILDSILSLMQEHEFDYRHVEEVEVQLTYFSDYSLYREPSVGLEGKFSVIYNAAAALVQGNVDINTFTDERINDPRIRETMSKIKVRILSKREERGHGNEPVVSPSTGRPVRVKLHDGRVFSKTIGSREMLGSSRNPWGWANIARKFETNASLALPNSHVQEAIERWSKLGEMSDIRNAVGCVLKPDAGLS
jgi:2-methylcitrate dehydratase PrpD